MTTLKQAKRTKQAATGLIRVELLVKLERVISQSRRWYGRSAEEEFVNLDAPVAKPKRQRGRPKGTKEWEIFTDRHDNGTLAKTVLGQCLRIWLNKKKDKLPSALTISAAIGGRLRVPKEKRAGVGRALLRFAELAGIVVMVKRHGEPHKVDLSVDTLLALELLYQQLLKYMVKDGEGLLARPTERAPKVQRKADQKIKPFRPRRGSIPARAARAIHRTQWQIDPFMRAVGDVSFTEPSDLFALVQAHEGPQSGYFPVRWDHRGRLHQVGGALTYTGGSDATRSLLQFAEAKPVTDIGRPWLARHLINQWDGDESRSVDIGDELAWVDAHRHLIAFAVAAPPMIVPAAEPFRFIAACRAWQMVEQGLPIALPVTVDASASVLQHMALLLRDVDLAKLVNLWPGERHDFYTAVGIACARIAIPEVKAVPAHPSRRIWNGHRKLIPARWGRDAIPAGQEYAETRDGAKKVAMTRFYGQSMRAAAQVMAGKRMPRRVDWDRAYRVRDAARITAPAAHALYMSLRQVAGELTKEKTPITWSTPSGWECIQDRRIGEPRELTAYLPDGGKVQYTETIRGAELHDRRQRNALTANLIQSLDASLLHLAIADLPDGLSLATAHDSFGTHADDVPVVLKALKDALREMYFGKDLLSQIWSAWGVKEPVPARGPWKTEFLKGRYTFC
jgi:hypothetical protein